MLPVYYAQYLALVISIIKISPKQRKRSSSSLGLASETTHVKAFPTLYYSCTLFQSTQFSDIREISGAICQPTLGDMSLILEEFFLSIQLLHIIPFYLARQLSWTPKIWSFLLFHLQYIDLLSMKMKVMTQAKIWDSTLSTE